LIVGPSDLISIRFPSFKIASGEPPHMKIGNAAFAGGESIWSRSRKIGIQ
jgi:hypothetical protein